MNNKYTNKETSKQLKEWGCDLESKYHYFFTDIEGYQLLHTDDVMSFGDYPAYDLLWDVCIKYAKEFWDVEGYGYESMDYRIMEFTGLLQQGKKQEAEDYFLEHTIFNPKNK